jgi:hypothetical protein
MKNFKTDYESELEILDYAISDLNVIAHLYECVFTYADTVRTNTRQDLETGYFLSSILRDITKKINKCMEGDNKKVAKEK